MQEEKDFHTQNLTRVKKERVPPVDKMFILDADNNEVQFEMSTLGFSTQIHSNMQEGDFGISNSQSYVKAMTGYQGQLNQLKLYQKCIKD